MDKKRTRSDEFDNAGTQGRGNFSCNKALKNAASHIAAKQKGDAFSNCLIVWAKLEEKEESDNIKRRARQFADSFLNQQVSI